MKILVTHPSLSGVVVLLDLPNADSNGLVVGRDVTTGNARVRSRFAAALSKVIRVAELQRDSRPGRDVPARAVPPAGWVISRVG